MKLREMDSFALFQMAVGVVLALSVGFYLLRTGGQEFPDDKRRWVEGGDAAHAPAVVETYGCGSCHQIPGIRDAIGDVGPPLVGLRDKQFIAGQIRNTPENLVGWIMNPNHVDPQTAMPDLGLTETEARHVAAYLYEMN